MALKDWSAKWVFSSREVKNNDAPVTVTEQVKWLPEVVKTRKQKQKREVMRKNSCAQTRINTSQNRQCEQHGKDGEPVV